MNDNDHDVLTAVQDSISALPMPKAPRLEAVTARGRARRRHRLTGVSAVAAGACAALVVGLAGGGGPGSPASPGSQHGAPAIHLAAFSVVSGPRGMTTLILYPGQVANPNAVRQALAQHGIAALVTANSFCHTKEHPAPPGQVILPYRALPPGAGKAPPAIRINPAAMPAGSKISIGYRQDRAARQISATVIKAGAFLICTSILSTENAVHTFHPVPAR
ncbi:MAG: hypothetical protein JOY82_08075 [Streptosporangiaceae bacterium]|nr:hypothetical protein [Streptosporangiaceae bacterium]MBV9854470.1 hypothetical protein [Streptosporangiaceae bacterium]